VDDTPAATLEGVGLTFDYQRLDAHGNPAQDLGGTAPSAAGNYTVTASFPGSADYAPVSNSSAFTIAPAAPAVTVTDAGGAYSGSIFPATAAVAGVVKRVDDTPSATLEGVGLALDYQRLDAGGHVMADLGATAPSAAGSYKVTVSFAGSADYAPASNSTTFSIAQAAPAVVVTDAGGTYSGAAFPAAATVAGVVKGVDDTPAATLEGVGRALDYQLLDAHGNPVRDLGSTPPSVAGSYKVTASFPGSADYAPASSSTTFGIVQAAPAVSVTDSGGAYTGAIFRAAVTVAGVIRGVDDTPSSTLEGVGLTLDYQLLDAGGHVTADLGATAPATAGHYKVIASFPGSADYGPASASTTFGIGPVAPAVAVTDAGGTYSGQAFPATTSVAGVVKGMNDTPSATLEGVGLTLDYQRLDARGNPIQNLGATARSAAGSYKVTASFAGSADYAPASNSATFGIAQAAPAVAVTDGGGTYSGSAFPAAAAVTGVVKGVDDSPAAILEGVGLTLDYQQLDSGGHILVDLVALAGSHATNSGGWYARE
jgi:hypothetical protein